MGFRIVIMILGFSIGLANCWPYASMPSGYPSGSRIQHLTMAIGMKLIAITSLVGSCLGVGLNVNVAPIANVEIDLPIDDYIEVETKNTVFDGIPVRIYRPSGSETEILPGIVYYHGGFYSVGSPDTTDVITRRLCRDTRSVVVSVDYRLAPLYTFPAGLEDCVKATKYFLLNAANYKVDANRVATCGDSAGGNAATAVSLILRDEEFPIKIKLQVLLYPWLQMIDFELPSMIQNLVGFPVPRDVVPLAAVTYIEGNPIHLLQYDTNNHVIKSFREEEEPKFINISKLPEEFLEGYERPPYPEGDPELWSKLKDKLLNPYLAPLIASDLKDLPEAYVSTMNHDPLRDEGYLYGIRLREANNKVTLLNSEEGFHALYNLLGADPYADSEFQKITNFIREKL